MEIKNKVLLKYIKNFVHDSSLVMKVIFIFDIHILLQNFNNKL